MPADPAPPTVPEVIARRRSTRAFDPDRPLDDETLRRVLGLATLAPSSFNLQPWRFVVVRSRRNRERLRAASYNQPKVTEAPVMLIVLGYKGAHATHLDPMLERRVALGMPAEAAAEVKGRVSATMAEHPDPATWALRSTMLAVGTLVVAAEALGVAATVMEGFDPARVREAFGVPDDHAICCLVALGHALKADPFPGRFSLEETCYEEHFGQPWTLGEPGPA